MKKNILKIVFASAFALVAGYGVYVSQQKVELSDLAMANVEALAHNEATGAHNHGPTAKPLFGSKYCKNEMLIDCNY